MEGDSGRRSSEGTVVGALALSPSHWWELSTIGVNRAPSQIVFLIEMTVLDILFQITFL